MIKIEGADKSFESCQDCVHAYDSTEICILRRCIHAFSELRECYKPKKELKPSAEPEPCEDTISRKAAIDVAKQHWYKPDIAKALEELPSAQPTEASCWGCNCPKMERLKEQKTFSEMVHLHDAKTHEERTETHACDLISRQAALNALSRGSGCGASCHRAIKALPSAQPEPSMEQCACCVLSKPERKKGKWIHERLASTAGGSYPVVRCSECQGAIPLTIEYHYCPICGADMRTPVEIARNIVHKAIDNSVWADSVDASEMHKVVDDKYAKMEGKDGKQNQD